MRIQKGTKNKCEFKNLSIGDVFYNPATDNLYLKVTRTPEGYNCVNLDEAYLVKMNNPNVIPVTDYTFNYNV